MATGLGAVAGTLFVEPAMHFRASTIDAQLRLVAFIGAGALISWLYGRVYMTRQAADADREQLKVTLARKAGVLATALDAIITIDEAGSVVEFNPAAERIFGYRQADVLGREMAGLIVPLALRDAHRTGMARHLTLGDGPVLNRRLELTAMRADGSEFPAEVSITQIPSSGPPLFTGHLRDITERKEREQALRRWQHIFTQAGWAVAVADAANRLEVVNPAFARMHGYSEEELIGRSLHDLVAPASRHQLPAALTTVANGDQPYESSHVRKNGSEFPCLTHMTAFTDESGSVTYRAATFQDLTDLHAAQDALTRNEKALREANADLEARIAERTTALTEANGFLQVLLDNVQDGIVACDANGVLTLFNRATREFHGLSEDRVPAERWAEHYHLFHADGVTSMSTEDVPLYRALQGEHVQGVEMVIAPTNGSRRVVQASGRSLLDEHGARLGAVVSMHDITARKEADQAVRRAQHELEGRVETRTAELRRANQALEIEVHERAQVEAALREVDRR